MRVTMTPQELEKRRMKAATLFAARVSQATVAKRLRVTKVAVHYWYRAWKKNGKEGLKKKKSGPKRGVTEKQLKRIEATLLKGPEHAGYATSLWTLARVGKIVERVTRIRYGQTQVWRIMKKLNWSVQKPERRSRERDETAIAHWRKVEWPSIKKRGAKWA